MGLSGKKEPSKKLGTVSCLWSRHLEGREAGFSCTWGQLGLRSETLSQKENFNWLDFVWNDCHIWERFCHGHIVTFFSLSAISICVCVWDVCLFIEYVYMCVCRWVSLCVCELAVGIGHLPDHSWFRCFRKQTLPNLELTNLARLAGQQAARTLLSPHLSAEVTGTNATISARDTNTGAHLCTPSTLPTESSFPDPKFTHFLN